MVISQRLQAKVFRPTALLVTAALASPTLLAGCGSNQAAAPGPPVDDTRGGTVTAPRPVGAPPAARQGLSTKQKMVILVGAAALYYMYRQHQKKLQAQGQQNVQYYRSKNGRVYYRDAKHTAHWVTPPAGGIQVPDSDANSYKDVQGYNNQPTGRGVNDLFQTAPDSP